MLDFYLFFKGDMLFANLLVIVYFLYAHIKKIKTGNTLKYSLAFVLLFYWLFFYLNFIFTIEESRGISKLIAMPLLIIYYLIIPIKKDDYIKRMAKVMLTCYILFWVIIMLLHSNSQM